MFKDKDEQKQHHLPLFVTLGSCEQAPAIRRSQRMHTHIRSPQTGAPLTHHHDIELKAPPEGLSPDLLLDGVKADVAFQPGLHGAPLCGLTHHFSHDLQEINKSD